MQHPGTYNKLLHIAITQIKALLSWGQLVYTFATMTILATLRSLQTSTWEEINRITVVPGCNQSR
jgi:hypothetical protein